MDKKLKKENYQELFLSELRNNHFGEKRLENAIRELETKENMKKLAKALKNIWKKTDENVKELEEVFSKKEIAEVKVTEPEAKEQAKVSEIIEPVEKEPETIHPKIVKSVKSVTTPAPLPAYQILTYDNLVELVDNLNTEQITQILESASSSETNNHYYLTKVAEKLVKERDSKA